MRSALLHDDDWPEPDGASIDSAAAERRSRTAVPPGSRRYSGPTGGADAPDRAPAPASDRGVPGRHTVTISGRGIEGYQSRNGTRPSAAARHTQLKRHERPGFRPDRVAMWAVLLGVVLMLAAATGSHAAVLNAVTGSHAAVLNAVTGSHAAALAAHHAATFTGAGLP